MTGVSKAMEVARTISTTPELHSSFDWSAAGAWAIFLGLLAVIIRQVGPWRQIFNDREAKFIESLSKRLELVETALADEQKARDAEQKLHEAQRALDRHRLNNVTQCFDAMLLMLKRAPEKVMDIIKDIEEMRSRQIQAEALEKAAIHSAALAAGVELPEDRDYA